MPNYTDKIIFIGLTGRKVIFETEPNLLNSNQMWWYSISPAMYLGTVKQAKEIAKLIRKDMELIEEKNDHDTSKTIQTLAVSTA